MGRKPLSPEEKAARKAAKAEPKGKVPGVLAEPVVTGESALGVMTFHEGQHPRTLRKLREQA